MSTRASLLSALLLLVTSCSAVPSNTETLDVTPTQRSDRDPRNLAVVTVDGGLTEHTQVGGEVVLNLVVTNTGSRDIQQLTVILNVGYVTHMTVLDTTPTATRHNEQGGEYFIFGPLASGQTENYVIRMSPRETGQFAADIDVAEFSPIDMTPLLDSRGGQAEFLDRTDVAAQ
jgi:hypothetical protein